MSNQRDLSIFYLIGGIGFLLLAVFSYVISPQHDTSVNLTSAGMALAGLLAIAAYFGLRRGRAR